MVLLSVVESCAVVRKSNYVSFSGGNGRKEGDVLFNDSLNTFYFTVTWRRTITQIVREETRCHHIDYSFRLTARVLLYAPSHRQDSTYHGTGWIEK